MDIEKVLRNLSDSLGLPPLTLDANRACAFLVDDELHTELRYDERADVLCLYAEVGRARPVEQSQLIQTLLETNADPQTLGGSHFGMTPDHDEVVLCRTLVGDDPSADMLLEELAELLTSSRQWRGRLVARELIVH